MKGIRSVSATGIRNEEYNKEMQIGVQTKNVVYDDCPEAGFLRLKQAGFSCADFSLNGYLANSALYRGERNSFFDKSKPLVN